MSLRSACSAAMRRFASPALPPLPRSTPAPLRWPTPTSNLRHFAIDSKDPQLPPQPSSRITASMLRPSVSLSDLTDDPHEPTPHEYRRIGAPSVPRMRPEMEEKYHRERESLELETEEDAGRTARLQAEAQEEEMKRLKGNFRTTSGVIGILGLAGWLYLGLPDEEEKKENAQKGFVQQLVSINSRAWGRVRGLYGSVQAPTDTKILPDPLPGGYQRPLTLFVELNDTLGHLAWDKNVGWRVATRPGVKQFLSYLSRYYEIVIFTTQPGMLAAPVVDAIDPLRWSMYQLYREHTRYVKGLYVKDLDTLNRDPKKVIMIDVDEKSYSLQPENGLLIKPWKGDPSDRELYRMTTVLEELAWLMTLNVEDVRPFLNSIRNFDKEDIPTAWEKYKADRRQIWDKPSANAPAAAAAPARGLRSSLSGLLGSGIGAGAAEKKSMNPFDLIEQMAREERAIFAKEQQDSKISFEALMKDREEAQKKMLEDMKSKKLKLYDLWGGTAMQPPPPQQG
ncbi:HAD-like domain-containing protein [Cladochytrium replicatum]|nr:HAD-like domain-containing protein [Cladochytrium replicatum]